MENNTLHITLYTIPQAACDEKKANWYDVASLLGSQMENVFKDRVRFSHIEFMSAEWFNDQHAQQLLLKNMVAFPFVLVDGEIASNEKKVNISRIRRFVESKLNNTINGLLI